MNKKGQALVEFVILVPVFIMILFALIDFGLILYNKCSLESKLNDTINMLENNENENTIIKFLNNNSSDKVKYKVTNNSEYKMVEIYTSLNLVTPGLGKIIENPYKVKVSRIIYE